MESKGLHFLSPEDLATLLTTIKYPTQVSILKRKIDIPDSPREWIPVDIGLKIDNIEYFVEITIPFQDYHGLACLDFFGYNPYFHKVSCHRTFERLQNWVEDTYIDWVKNDTGQNLSKDFIAILLRELERITALFETE